MTDFVHKLRQAQEGNQEALEHLVQEFGWVVNNECRQFFLATPAELSSADLRQEIWLRIWSKLDRFDIQDGALTLPKFTSWLRIVSKRVILSLVEKRYAQRRKPQVAVISMDKIDVKDDGKTASYIFRQEDQRQKIRDAIEALSTEEMKKIIVMRFFDNLSLKQIACRLQISVDQVRYRFQSAMRELEATVSS